MSQAKQCVPRAAEPVSVNCDVVPSVFPGQRAYRLAAPLVDLDRQQAVRLEQIRRPREQRSRRGQAVGPAYQRVGRLEIANRRIERLVLAGGEIRWIRDDVTIALPPPAVTYVHTWADQVPSPGFTRLHLSP